MENLCSKLKPEGFVFQNCGGKFVSSLTLGWISAFLTFRHSSHATLLRRGRSLVSSVKWSFNIKKKQNN